MIYQKRIYRENKLGANKMLYERDEYYENEDSDIYKKAMRSLLLEDDEIDEIEDAFMEGYNSCTEDCECDQR
jgi:hypothetical protein